MESVNDALPLGAPDWTRGSEDLFDGIADTVYFLKDASGRYVSVNQTLVERCGLESKNELLGNTAKAVFPEPLASAILAQDRRVLTSGARVRAKLEMHLYAGGHDGWCLTWKEPTRDEAGRVVGLLGISRDLTPSPAAHDDLAQIAGVMRHVDEHLDGSLRVPELAAMTDFSPYQLDRRLRSVVGLGMGQYIIRARIDHACTRLRESDDAISTIALDCGYGDQAAVSGCLPEGVARAF